MSKQIRRIAQVWVRRPMMWFLSFFALFVVLVALIQRDQSNLRHAYVIPHESTSHSGNTLKSERAFWDALGGDQMQPQFGGIDFKAMGLSGSGRRDVHQWANGLALFPNVKWIRFDRNQIAMVPVEQWEALPELRTVIVEDNQITADDIETLSHLEQIETLVLNTYDLPASIEPLSRLPNLSMLVLSGSGQTLQAELMDNPFRREVLDEIQTLKRLKDLALKPTWIPGHAFESDGKTPWPSSDANLKRNASEALRDHPSLTRLWIGVDRYETENANRETVAAALPGVAVLPAQYNEWAVARGIFGLLVILGLAAACLFNLTGHFSTPSARVIPGYHAPHRRFVYAFLIVMGAVSTCLLHAPQGIAWVSSLALSSVGLLMAVALSCSMAIWTIESPRRGAILPLMLFPLMLWPAARPVIQSMFPNLEPVLERFLRGDFPMVAVGLLIICVPSVIWLIRQFRDQDRLFAQHALEPTISVHDMNRQNTMMAMQRAAEQMELKAVTWREQLGRIRGMAAGRLRTLRLDWLGEPSITMRVWAVILAIACLATVVMERYLTVIREFGFVYLIMMPLGAGAGMIVISAMGRRDVACSELLYPISRSDFVWNRAVSVFTRVVCLFVWVFFFAGFLNFWCGGLMDPWVIGRTAIQLAALALATTGLVLYGLASRSVVALFFLVAVGTTALTLSAMACLDYRWILADGRGSEIHSMLGNPLFYLVTGTSAPLILWLGFRKLIRCELALE